MRTNEEFTKAVYERRDDFLVKRKNRRKKVAAALSPLVLCLIVFSAVVLPNLSGQYMKRSEGPMMGKPSMDSSDRSQETSGNSSLRSEGVTYSLEFYEDNQEPKWKDTRFAEDSKDIYDTISVVQIYETVKEEEKDTSDKTKYAIWLTKDDEKIVFVMEEESLYFNGEYCRELDEPEIKYLLSLAD